MRKTVLLHQCWGKKVSTLRDKFCEEEAFSYLLSKDKDRVGYDASRYILISPSVL